MASNNVKEFTDATFRDAMKEGVVLVDFWAPWCGPCRMQGPILEDVASRAPEGVTIGKVNVDEEPRLAARFGVQSIPTLLVLADGEVVKQFVGVQTAANLQNALREAMTVA
jgi:thioredoxin 1